MKRNLLLYSILFFFFTQNSKAQQTLQKITPQTNQTIVELFQIRNGTANTNVIGSGWYNQDLSQGSGTEIMYLEATNLTYTNQLAVVIPIGVFPAEQIGNGTFEIASTPYTNNKSGKIYNWKNGTNTLPGGEFSVNTYDTDRDAIEDGNTNVDMLHSRWILPHTYDNGTALPVGLWMILLSRQGEKNGGGAHGSKRIGFRWNGSQWIQQANDPAGTPFDNMQQATLAVNEFEIMKNEIQIYPNPAKDFITIKNEKTENLSYQIFDISGKLIVSGKSKSNEKIYIKTLEKGNYFLQIQNENGQKQNLKFIKN